MLRDDHGDEWRAGSPFFSCLLPWSAAYFAQCGSDTEAVRAAALFAILPAYVIHFASPTIHIDMAELTP